MTKTFTGKKSLKLFSSDLFSICRKKHEINYNFLFLIRRQENQRLERILVVLINFFKREH